MSAVDTSVYRCDRPGCTSAAEGMYLVGLGGMLAYYCDQHRPVALPPYPREAWPIGRELRGEIPGSCDEFPIKDWGA